MKNIENIFQVKEIYTEHFQHYQITNLEERTTNMIYNMEEVKNQNQRKNINNSVNI